MTREEARKAAEVMLAYADGKEIEFKLKSATDWESGQELVFDWELFDYRVKQEPKYRPYTFEEFINVLKTRNGYVIHKKLKIVKSITRFSVYGVEIAGESAFSFELLFEIYTWLDGTPCGIKEE